MHPEFEMAGSRYRYDGMPGPVELRILRRLAPLIAPTISSMFRRGNKPGVRIEVRPDYDVVKVFAAVFGAFGTLSDADTDMIQQASLGALSRDIDGTWQQVWPPTESYPVFADIDGVLILRLIGRSLGFVVKNWMDRDADAIPAEFRKFASVLH